MPEYELRLYKSTPSNKNLHTLIDRIPFVAKDDAEAIEKARSFETPTWDDSDLAILFDEGGKQLWFLRR